MKGRWPITLMCEVLQVSTSGYFRWDASTRNTKHGGRRLHSNEVLLAHVRAIHEQLRGENMAGRACTANCWPVADMALERLTFDKVFTSADGVDVELGLCEGSIEQAWFKDRLFRRARQVIVLATAEKLNRRSQMYWSPISRAWTLVTDAQAQEHQLHPFIAHAFVNVVRAPLDGGGH